MVESVTPTSYPAVQMDNLVKLAHEYLSMQSRGVSSRWVEDKAEKLLNEIGPSLQAFIHIRCKDHHAAEDLYQDTLLIIFQKVGQFRGSTNRELWGWCYRIAKNRLNKFFLKQNRVELIDLEAEEINNLAAPPVDGNNPGDQLDHEYARRLVNAAKKPCGSFLNAYYILELDNKTIAEELSMTVDAVRMRIKRCLEETMASIT